MSAMVTGLGGDKEGGVMIDGSDSILRACATCMEDICVKLLYPREEEQLGICAQVWPRP